MPAAGVSSPVAPVAGTGRTVDSFPENAGVDLDVLVSVAEVSESEREDAEELPSETSSGSTPSRRMVRTSFLDQDWTGPWSAVRYPQ